MKNYLVTGGTSGIGKAISLRLAEENRVVVVGRNQESLDGMEKMNPHISGFAYDLLCLDNIQEIFSFCQDREMKLDGLVYSAGIARNVPVAATDTDDMKDVFTVNCLAFEEMMKYFSKKKYSQNGASVVAITSISTIVLPVGRSIYASSKSALITMVKVLANELSRRKIRVNAVQPGFVDTETTRTNNTIIGELDDIIKEQQPWGMIQPEQVADLTEFLLSEKAEMITGSVIPITGGRAL